MLKWLPPLCAAAFCAATTSSALADVRVGTLRCDVSPGVSYIVGSQKGLNCVFYSAQGYTERYVGGFGRLGIDLGYTTGGVVSWWVYAPSRPGPGALAGGYGGASASATVGAGVSANALIGGLNNSISLQPFSVGAQGGLDAAVTVSGMQLNWVAPSHRRHRKHR